MGLLSRVFVFLWLGLSVPSILVSEEPSKLKELLESHPFLYAIYMEAKFNDQFAVRHYILQQDAGKLNDEHEQHLTRLLEHLNAVDMQINPGNSEQSHFLWSLRSISEGLLRKKCSTKVGALQTRERNDTPDHAKNSGHTPLDE